MSWSNKSTIHTCSKTVNAQYYTQILSTHLLPTMPNSNRYIFQHDNAAPHTAKHTKNWLAGMGVKVLEDWPPYSPELNVIEHVWSWMTAYINKEMPKNRRELKRYIRAAWNNIPQSTIHAYINNLPAVMKRIIDAEVSGLLRHLREVYCTSHGGGSTVSAANHTGTLLLACMRMKDRCTMLPS